MSDVLLRRRHERSGRSAIVADEGDSVWLYLTEPAADAISADCWLYNRIVAPPLTALREQFAAYRSRALPPPAPADILAPEAVGGALGTTDLRLQWSRDGNAAAAWDGGHLIGFITAGHRRGFNRFLIAEGPWGAPFDRDLYERSFPPERG